MFSSRGMVTRTKILTAMQELLAEREYITITTADVANRAGVNEALIYHYFKNKDDLLWSVLEEYMQEYVDFVKRSVEGAKDYSDKLRKVIWANIFQLLRDHPGGKIMLLESRNNKHYFATEAYNLSLINVQIILDIVKKGIAAGEFSEKINPHALRNLISGAIEHAVMPVMLFMKSRNTNELSEQICEIIFKSIRKKENITAERLVERLDSIEEEIRNLKHGIE